MKLNKEEGMTWYYHGQMIAKDSREDYIKIINDIEHNDYGLNAVELVSTGEFMGFMGFTNSIANVTFVYPVLISWKIHKKFFWNEVVLEGIKECLKYGVNVLKFTEIYGSALYEDVNRIKLMKNGNMKCIDRRSDKRTEKNYYQYW